MYTAKSDVYVRERERYREREREGERERGKEGGREGRRKQKEREMILIDIGHNYGLDCHVECTVM